MTDGVHEITMPKLGESVTEGTVNLWLKSVGEPVAFDDPLFEVSTDKVDSEIPSPYDGVLAEIAVPAGETVAVGTVLARIARAGVVLGSTTSIPSPAAGPPASIGGATEVAVVPRPVLNGPLRLLSPVVRRLAGEHGLDLTTIVGSGGGGRIMREDVLAAVAEHARPATVQHEADIAVPTAGAASRAGVANVPAQGAPWAGAQADQVVPLSRIRLVTAERMLRSKQLAPHVWTSVEVDVEAIEQIRQKYKERFRKENGTSLTYLPFIARAACDALQAFPTINASVDIENKTMTLHRQVNLAIAVDLDEQGLMAPVIKDADTLNLRGMARAIRAVAEGAKRKTLKTDDLAGSTFTLTNPGPLGSFASAPIINQPNVAIMSTEGVTRRPVVVGDAIAIHHTCVLGFSYDHRAFDGVTAARFLMYVRDALQDRDWGNELG
jgi:2-oxoglutarate dehydrogenase E2 component (dihydrolipoamide succinyltransferase)